MEYWMKVLVGEIIGFIIIIGVALIIERLN
jgi:hypothetical protein